MALPAQWALLDVPKQLIAILLDAHFLVPDDDAADIMMAQRIQPDWK